jgi:hypothetical protein
MGINLRGEWSCMKFELQQMRKQGSDAIVNCSTLGGLIGGAERGIYHAAKHGVLGFTKSAALEYAARGMHQRHMPRDDRDGDVRSDGALMKTSNCCGANPPSSQSFADQRTERAETISRIPAATPATRSSQPSATISAGCSHGWRF